MMPNNNLTPFPTGKHINDFEMTANMKKVKEEGTYFCKGLKLVVEYLSKMTEYFFELGLFSH